MRQQTTYSEAVIPIVRRVRAMLLPRFGTASFTQKVSGSKKFELLTELDVRVEKFLKKEFARLYPDIPFVGEETEGQRGGALFWLVDPIDGTAYFIRGLPFCTCQGVLISKGEALFSFVYDFVNDIVYHAAKGQGAFANKRAIRVSRHPLSGSRLITAFDLNRETHYRECLALKERCLSFFIGSSGYEFSLIASGKLDGVVCQSEVSKDYDVAPGLFLIKEAGGIVANIGSRAYDYRNGNFIAANPLVFRELTEGPDAIFPISENKQ